MKPLIRHISELVARKDQIELTPRAMRGIAHPLRLEIQCVPGTERVSAPDIVEAVGSSPSNISQHLAILRGKEILRSRRDANRVFYSLKDQRSLKLTGMLRKFICGTGERS